VSAVSDTCGDPKCENHYFKFVVQSPNKLPEEIMDKNKRFCTKFRNKLVSIKDQDIKDIIDGCVNVLLYPFDNITDLSEYYFKQIENKYYKFDLKEILINTYKIINKNSLLEFYDKYIINNKNTLNIGIIGKK
jgi:secreted Zn-dependent insulinase-like peptidase